jgi:Beta-lactamase class C and other penicillin binding proteins
MNKAHTIETIFSKATRSKQIHEAVLLVENPLNNNFSVNFGYGGKGIDSPLLMASVTKLFTTACILILQEQKKLSLDQKIGVYFDKTILNGLHVYKGEDYSEQLTNDTSRNKRSINNFYYICNENLVYYGKDKCKKKDAHGVLHMLKNGKNKFFLKYDNIHFNIKRD